jgi:hypothetical protein
MYRSLGDAIDGFSKNAVPLCHGLFGAMAVSLFVLFVYLVPFFWLLKGAIWPLATAGTTAFLFGLSCRQVRFPIWYGLLYPAAFVLMEWVVWRSILWHWRGAVQWKGRSYRVR